MRFVSMPIYKKAIHVLEVVYAMTNVMPKQESFNMISQINRSALSISSNIAEGSGKNSDKDFARFISIAKGSLYETFSIATAIGLIYPTYLGEIHNIQGLLDDLSQELEIFRKFLTKKKAPEG